MAAKSSATQVGSFRGDFDALAAMMQQSWADNPNQGLLYSEAFLRSAFDYPGSSFDLAPAIYKEADILGFVAGFPRSVRLDSQPARLILTCFLTASAAVKGSGLGLKLWADLIGRSRAEKYDGAISLCIEGDPMNGMLPGLSRLLKLNTQRIFSTGFLVHVVRPAPAQPAPEIVDADIDLFMELASALPADLPFVREWTRAEAAWQLRNRTGAIAVSTRVDGRRGMLTGYLAQAASSTPMTVVLLEDLLWGDLAPAECSELLKKFLQAAAFQGAGFVSCPMLGYSSVDPLKAAGFRRSGRVLHIYLTLWNGLEARPVPALYTDIF
jgi:hypothetical protein